MFRSCGTRVSKVEKYTSTPLGLMPISDEGNDFLHSPFDDRPDRYRWKSADACPPRNRRLLILLSCLSATRASFVENTVLPSSDMNNPETLACRHGCGGRFPSTECTTRIRSRRWTGSNETGEVLRFRTR